MKQPEQRASASPPDEFVSRNYPINDEIAFQRKSWHFERIGWFLLVLIVLLTLLGLFSKGPLSTGHVSTADGALRVEYQRFQRHGAHGQLVVTVHVAPSSSAAVRFSPQLLENFTLEGIYPEPLHSSTQQGGLLLESRADTQGALKFYLALRPEGLGSIRQSVRLNEQTVEFFQFIYP